MSRSIQAVKRAKYRMGAPDMWKQGRQGARSQAYLSFNSFWVLPLPRFYHFSSSHKKSSLCTFQPYTYSLITIAPHPICAGYGLKNQEIQQ